MMTARSPNQIIPSRPPGPPRCTSAPNDGNQTQNPLILPKADPSLKALRSGARRSSLFSFLAVKEPSGQALAEYYARTKASRKGSDTHSYSRGRPPLLSGVSSQKLPGHVPKVNSKWDGLPPSRSKPRGRDRMGSTSSEAPSLLPDDQVQAHQDSVRRLEKGCSGSASSGSQTQISPDGMSIRTTPSHNPHSNGGSRPSTQAGLQSAPAPTVNIPSITIPGDNYSTGSNFLPPSTRSPLSPLLPFDTSSSSEQSYRDLGILSSQDHVPGRSDGYRPDLSDSTLNMPTRSGSITTIKSRQRTVHDDRQYPMSPDGKAVIGLEEPHPGTLSGHEGSHRSPAQLLRSHSRRSRRAAARTPGAQMAITPWDFQEMDATGENERGEEEDEDGEGGQSVQPKLRKMLRYLKI